MAKWWNLEWLAPTPKAYPGQPDAGGTSSGTAPSSGVARTATQIAYNPALAPSAGPAPAKSSHAHDVAAAATSSPLMQAKSAPLAFVVPAGCNAVHFSEGPIRAVQGGQESDLALLIPGGATLSGTTGLKAGDTVTYTALWLTGDGVVLGANRVMREVHAHFYSTAQCAAMVASA
jgi:hypothetical protein